MTPRALVTLVAVAALAVPAAGCGDDDDTNGGRNATAPSGAAGELDRVVKIGRDRRLYVHCAGRRSPTVVMEAGDADTSDYYSTVASNVAKTTRTCVYDRANLGRSGPAPGPRGLRELVGDLEQLLAAARIPGPYVLVGSSGGGYISAGYALANPGSSAGVVLFNTFSPYPNPPADLVRDTNPGNPANVEHRDYLQVERDAWSARKRIRDIPVRVVTVDYGNAAQNASERTNVRDQRGWLVLSRRAKQVVVDTGHSVVEDDPELATDVILDVVENARRPDRNRPAGDETPP